jgi:transcription antitermination protein NusB
MGAKPSEVLEEWRAHGRSVPAYTADLVTGVEQDIRRIDRLLGSHAEDWTVQRMAVVDRTILRVACHELQTGIPAAVAINEAVEAANELSTDDSGRFINGILGRMVKDIHEDQARGEPGQEGPLSPGRSGRPSGPPRSRPP